MRRSNDELTLSGTDMTTNITSHPIYLGHIVSYSVQLGFTGSPNGTFSLEASNDDVSLIESRANDDIVNWTTIDGSEVVVTSAGSYMFNVQDAAYLWVRVVWTDSTSGSPSTLSNARFNAKGV